MSDELPRMRPRRVRIRRPRNTPRRLSGFSVNRMVPNALTVLALCAGMTAIRFAISDNFPAAVYAIMIAAVLDGLDGRIARLLRATSHFGAELDSLSDFILGFSASHPAAVTYLCGRCSNVRCRRWAIVLFFAVCCAAAAGAVPDDSSSASSGRVACASQYFTGVPAPAAAMLAIMPMFCAFEWGDWIVRSPYLVGVWTVGIAGLLVRHDPDRLGEAALNCCKQHLADADPAWASVIVAMAPDQLRLVSRPPDR